MDPLFVTPSRPVVTVLAVALALNALGSAFALLHPSLRRPERASARAAILSWWPITLFWALPCLFGPVVALLCCAIVSALTLREYVQLLPQTERAPLTDVLVFLSVPLHYVTALGRDTAHFVGVVLAWSFVVIPVVRMRTVGVEGFLNAASRTLLGVLATVLSISCVFTLFWLPQRVGPAGPEGIAAFFLLFVLLNDASQWIAGKLLGRTRIAPTISPNKTWEGLAGGVAINAVVAVALARVVTPFSTAMALGLAVALSLLGFAGDLFVSAIKRDLGVKDTGSAIPGQGGLLDRHDSMVFNAPAFAWLMHRLYA